MFQAEILPCQTKRLSVRALLLAGALALVSLIPVARADAATFQQIPFCQPFATSVKVPARSYCTRAAAGYTPFVYGSFQSVAVASGTNGLRHCAIIDVYRRSPSAYVQRYKTCTYSGEAWAFVTNSAYTNPFNYYMIALAYNGSDSPQLLSGYAFGYKL
jgi:hypothetical protein